KSAIAVGIGVFICLIGLVDAGFVRRLPDAAHTTVPVGLGINGSIASWPTAVFVVGLLVTGVLVVRKVKGAILIGVLASTVLAIVVEAIVKAGPSKGTNPLGWNLGYPALPDQVFGLPNLSLVGDVSFGAWTRLPVVTGVLFLAAMFLTPLYQVVPVEAAAPALVVVGAMLMAQVRDIDFTDYSIALPAFLTIVVMPFTYSIANGIGAGFVSYAVIRAATGKARQVHPL